MGQEAKADTGQDCRNQRRERRAFKAKVDAQQVRIDKRGGRTDQDDSRREAIESVHEVHCIDAHKDDEQCQQRRRQRIEHRGIAKWKPDETNPLPSQYARSHGLPGKLGGGVKIEPIVD